MRKFTLFFLLIAILFSLPACGDTENKTPNENSAWDFPLDEQLDAVSAGRVYREAWTKTQAHTERDYTTTVSLTDDNTLYDYTSFIEEHRVYTDIGGEKMAVSLNGSIIDYTGAVSPFLFFYVGGQAYTNNYDINSFYRAPCTPEEVEVLLGYDYCLDSKGDFTVYSGKRNADGTYTISYSTPDETLLKDLRDRMGSYAPTTLSPENISGTCIIMEDGYVSSDIMTVKGTYLTYNEDVYQRTLVYDFKENTSAITFNPLTIPSHITAIPLDSLTAVHYLNNAYAPLDDFEALAVTAKNEITASMQKKTASQTTDITLLRETLDGKLHATMSATVVMTEDDKVLSTDQFNEEYKNGLTTVNQNGEISEYTPTELTYLNSFASYYDFYSSTVNMLTTASIKEEKDTYTITYTLNDTMAFGLANEALVSIFTEDVDGLVYEDEDTVLETQVGTMVINKSDKSLLSHTFTIKGSFPTSKGELTLDNTFTLTVGGNTNAKVGAMMAKSTENE